MSILALAAANGREKGSGSAHARIHSSPGDLFARQTTDIQEFLDGLPPLVEPGSELFYSELVRRLKSCVDLPMSHRI
eukprot:259423-Alexandrium_andersonii.AAC.1